MGDIVLDYLIHQDEKSAKETSLKEFLVPSPCDTCVFKIKCADKLLACRTFSLFVYKREKKRPALFATNGKDRKPTKKIYKEHFAHTGKRQYVL